MYPRSRVLVPLVLTAMLCVPGLVLAQTSPFMTGATALQTNVLAWLTPIAIILVMILGGMAMANRIARELVNRHGFAVDIAIHAPRTDPRNFHAHVLATTREINSSGFGAKTDLEIADSERRSRGLDPFYKEVVNLRERWAVLTNSALERAQVTARVDHRSLEAQGIEREPQPILPRSIYEMERRGQYTQLGEQIRADYRERVAARTHRIAPASLREDIRRVMHVRNGCKCAWASQTRSARQ